MPKPEVSSRVIELLKLNLEARDKLGPRFALWPEKYLDANKKSAMKTLAGWLAREGDTRALGLKNIVVFGKDKGSCSLFQATETGLNSIADRVRFMYVETPDELNDHLEFKGSDLSKIGQGIHK